MSICINDVVQTSLGGAIVVGFERFDDQVRPLPMADVQRGNERVVVNVVDSNGNITHTHTPTHSHEIKALGKSTIFDAHCVGAILRSDLHTYRSDCPWNADYVLSSGNVRTHFSGYYFVNSANALNYFGIYGWSGTANRDTDKFVEDRKWLRIVDDFEGFDFAAFDALVKISPLLAANVYSAIITTRLGLDDGGSSENSAFDLAESLGVDIDEASLLSATALERLLWLLKQALFTLGSRP